MANMKTARADQKLNLSAETIRSLTSELELQKGNESKACDETPPAKPAKIPQ
jgi:hypothetical protein